jgi:hypothetical protein
LKNAAYFAPLVVLPTIIVEPGSYVTRSGEVVSVSAVSRGYGFTCDGLYPNGVRERWHRSGRISASRETANDIVRAANGRGE